MCTASILALQSLLERKFLGRLKLDILKTEASLLQLHLVHSLFVLSLRDVDRCRVCSIKFFLKLSEKIERLRLKV